MTEAKKLELLQSLQVLSDEIKDLQSLIAYAEVDEMMDDAVQVENALKRMASKIKATPATK